MNKEEIYYQRTISDYALFMRMSALALKRLLFGKIGKFFADNYNGEAEINQMRAGWLLWKKSQKTI